MGIPVTLARPLPAYPLTLSPVCVHLSRLSGPGAAQVSDLAAQHQRGHRRVPREVRERGSTTLIPPSPTYSQSSLSLSPPLPFSSPYFPPKDT